MKSPSNNQRYKFPEYFKNCLEEEEYKSFEDYYNTPATRKFREVMTKALESEIRASFDKSEKENKYEMPSWSEYQADHIGFRRAVRKIIHNLR